MEIVNVLYCLAHKAQEIAVDCFDHSFVLLQDA